MTGSPPNRSGRSGRYGAGSLMNPLRAREQDRLVDVGPEGGGDRRGRPAFPPQERDGHRGRCLPRDGAAPAPYSRSGSRYVAPHRRSGEPPSHRDRVAAVVEDRAARQVAAVVVGGVGVGTGIEAPVELHHPELTDLAALQQLGEPHRLGMHSEGEGLHQEDARGPCRVDRQGCPGRGHADRLLAQDLLAGRRRLDGELHVDVMRRRDVHELDRRVGDQLVVRPVRTLDAELGREGLRLLEIAARDGR